MDSGVDYYDARVCTASEPCPAVPSAPVPACQGEACHGTPAGVPVFGAPGSATFSGAGNLVTVGAKLVVKPRKKAKPKKKARRRGKRRKGRGAVSSGRRVKRGGKR
jgi:hypothetical protein